jgi:hypothetical protein
MRLTFASVTFASAIAMSASVSNATIVTVYDDFDGGLTNFNNTVALAGGTAIHDNWSNLPSGTSITRPDYTVTQNDGSSMFPAVYTLFNSSPSRQTSGDVVSIDPYGPSRGLGAKPSGVTLAFNTAINSIGFEVGDWSTCCQPTDLYISFDNGAPILVGASTTLGDAFLTNNGAGVFVAAFDDSASFTTVQFWGDGFGEVLNFGGTVHYALLDVDSLPQSTVPEPSSIALLSAGLLGLVIARRKRHV